MNDYSSSFVLAIDQGTSATSTSIYTHDGQLVDSANMTLQSSFPRPGWVEQDPVEVLDTVRQTIQAVIRQQKLRPEQIMAVGLANQGESFLLWDLENGQPLYPIINWQCVRSADLCRQLIADGLEPNFKQRTGLPIDPEWPATKIRWLLDHVSDLAKMISQGRIAFGQLDAWIIYNLTGKQRHVTDHSTASRSGFYNITSRNWDPTLQSMFDAQGIMFPRILDSAGDFGMLDLGDGWEAPLRGLALDQSAALLGQGCVDQGDLKITYGTCSALWVNIGPKPTETTHLSTSVAWQIRNNPTYAIVGEAGTAGSSMDWLKDKLKVPWSIAEMSAVARSAQGQDNLTFVNAFSGLGAPHWSPETQGTLYGLTAGTGLEHFVRAALQAVAFSVRDLLEALVEEEGFPVSDMIIVDGGMTANDYLMQFQADILGRAITVPANFEGTSKGVAFLASILQKSDPQLDSAWKQRLPGVTYEPQMSGAEREEKYELWRSAVVNAISAYSKHR